MRSVKEITVEREVEREVEIDRGYYLMQTMEMVSEEVPVHKGLYPVERVN